MSETITTTQLLDFLVKADKVSSHVNVVKMNGGYKIIVLADWYNDGHFAYRTTCITEEGHFTLQDSDCGFFTMGSALDALVEREEEREMKRQKRQQRQELLSRLTDEEKELLGVY